MRRFRRLGYTVPTLADTGVAGRTKLQHRSEYEDPEKKNPIPQKFGAYWTTNPDVRGLLQAMQGRICAYCLTERPLDVEHFRPKGAIDGDNIHKGYWWLAYEAANYFLGCTACNRDRKGTRFPLRAGAVRVTYETRNTLAAEQRVLLDPLDDDVETYFMLNDDPTCPILPSPDLPPPEQERAQDVIDFFGLNLDATVRTRRSRAYEKALRAAKDADWATVRKMAMRHSEQSFAARFVLARLAPQHLPSEKDELLDLVQMLWSDLKIQIAEIQKLKTRSKTPRGLDKRQLKSYCWALIVLQQDPPPGYGKDVQNLLAELMKKEPEESAKEIMKAFRAVSKVRAK